MKCLYEFVNCVAEAGIEARRSRVQVMELRKTGLFFAQKSSVICQILAQYDDILYVKRKEIKVLFLLVYNLFTAYSNSSAATVSHFPFINFIIYNNALQIENCYNIYCLLQTFFVIMHGTETSGTIFSQSFNYF
jgi:hypothetical protein